MADYFLSKDLVDEIKESELDELKCLVEFKNVFILESVGLRYNPTLKFQTFHFQRLDDIVNLQCRENISKSMLPIEFGRKCIKISKERCVYSLKCKVINDEYTQIFVENEQENVKFDNEEQFLHCSHPFDKITAKAYTDNYLCFTTSNYYEDRKQPVYFILFKVYEKNNNEKVLTEIFRQNLDELSAQCNVEKVQFNTNLSKILLFIDINTTPFLLTFDINTCKFSNKQGILSMFEVKDCSFPDEVPLLIFWPDIWYGYHHCLKDVIVIPIMKTSMVYIVKESSQQGFYIFKQIKLSFIPSEMKCCINRNNQVLLFVCIPNATGNEEILAYDVLKEKLHDSLRDNNCSTINSNTSNNYVPVILIGNSGEEIIVATKDRLHLFVYKSKIHSLKEICQFTVLQQYTKQELAEINLPKRILQNN